MMLNGILKGNYQELLDVIAHEIPLPTFVRARSRPCPRICRLRHCSQAAAGDGSRMGIMQQLAAQNPLIS